MTNLLAPSSLLGLNFRDEDFTDRWIASNDIECKSLDVLLDEQDAILHSIGGKLLKSKGNFTERLWFVLGASFALIVNHLWAELTVVIGVFGITVLIIFLWRRRQKSKLRWIAQRRNSLEEQRKERIKYLRSNPEEQTGPWKVAPSIQTQNPS